MVGVRDPINKTLDIPTHHYAESRYYFVKKKVTFFLLILPYVARRYSNVVNAIIYIYL